jgi:hypothetical protein
MKYLKIKIVIIRVEYSLFFIINYFRLFDEHLFLRIMNTYSRDDIL